MPIHVSSDQHAHRFIAQQLFTLFSSRDFPESPENPIGGTSDILVTEESEVESTRAGRAQIKKKQV